MGKVQDEEGLAPVYARWLGEAQPLAGRGITHVQADHIVSMAGMPLPQWIVARVSQSQALLAPLRGAQREAWWLAVASMVLCMLLAMALMGWMAQPLAQLTFKARQLLRTSARQQPAQAVDWPRAGGEVGELVRVFQGLVQQGSLQQSRKDTVVGQFQAVLDSAPVGIVITRHGMLEVASHQACVMLGYTAQELQGRPARILYASDADYAQVATAYAPRWRRMVRSMATSALCARTAAPCGPACRAGACAPRRCTVAPCGFWKTSPPRARPRCSSPGAARTMR